MSIEDYLPVSLEDVVPGEIEFDISETIFFITEEAMGIEEEFLNMETEYATIATESMLNAGVDVSIGTGSLLGKVVGSKKDPITGNRPLDIHVKSDLSIGEKFIRKAKELASRIWAAIKNFFLSIFHFFQSKVFQADKMLSNTNFPIITEYYNNRAKNITANLTEYAISDPVAEYIKDAKVLQLSIPLLRNAILNIINTVETRDIAGKANQRAMSANIDEVQAIANHIYGGILPSGANASILSEMNISRFIRQKYFGESKHTKEQEIRDVIKHPNIYEAIMSDSSYRSFKDLFRENEKTIREASREMDKFRSELQNINVSSTFYTELQQKSFMYRRLLTTMLFTCVAYWDLYFTIYSDTLRSIRAILAQKN
jgi:hypothetical protein